VLKAEGTVRDSRLALCSATKKVLATGLNLLGIEALDRM
jgi:arginyl-tRNA synthetase